MPLQNVQLGAEIIFTHPGLVNLYGCLIGDGTKTNPLAEIQKNSHVGALRKISSPSFVCDGVTVEDEVSIGHGVTFTSEFFSHLFMPEGELTCIRHGDSIGSNTTNIYDTTVGRFALIGAKAMATRNMLDYTIVAGAPARVVGDIREREDLSIQVTEMAAP